MDDRTCQQCGKPITRRRPKRGPQPKYCTDSCKARAGKLAAIADGRYAAQQAAQSARKSAERAANARPCPYCGTPMESPRRVQCGGDECERRFNNERNLVYRHGYKERTGQHYRYKYEYEHTCEACGKSWTSRQPYTRFCSQACHNRIRRWELTCEVCGTSWPAGRADARFCSQECHDAAYAAARAVAHAARSRLVPYTGADPRPRVARLAVLPPLRRRWYAGFCADCREPFIYDQPQTITCSHRCARRLSKAKRRAAELEAFVEHVSRGDVFERDGWRCQLCRKPVDRTKVVPHPKAPVLDHIIPLAAGGTHEPANVQCAHFLCNSLKGGRGGGEQLLLIG